MGAQDLTGTHIYWFTSMGLIIGLLFGLIIKEEGVSLVANLFWGVVAANVMGIIGMWMEFGDGLWFSFLGTIPFLFLVNVFHTHHKEDLLIEPEQYAHIVRKRRKKV